MKLISSKKITFIKYLLLKCSERTQGYVQLLDHLSRMLKSNSSQLKTNQDQITLLENMLDSILTSPKHYQADKHEQLLGYYHKLSLKSEQLLSIKDKLNNDYRSTHQILCKELHTKTKLTEKLANSMKKNQLFLEIKDIEDNLELYITQSFYVSE